MAANSDQTGSRQKFYGNFPNQWLSARVPDSAR